MDNNTKILIVDDDKRIVNMLEEYLKLYNFNTISAFSGRDCLAYLDESISLIILDINMDDIDGIKVCEKIRKNYEVPIIMLSANTASFDKIRALGAGADDYVVKPFDPLELLARIKVHINRLNRYKRVHKPLEIISVQDIKIYKDSYKVTKGDRDLNFSNTEFRLFLFFAENPGVALDRKKILETVWKSDLYDEGIINTYVKRIREKIGTSNKEIIKSVRGVGYIFNDD